MLFTYDKTEKIIKTIPKTSLKDHNIFERQDLEKWIEENPAILGENLMILSSEFDKFDKTRERIDLLAMDQDGSLVIIELKRDDSGKNADLQAIKYAAFCSNFLLDDVIELHQQYCRKKNQHLSSDAVREKILDFITDKSFKNLNDVPRIILVSKEYRQEVTASVLWLRKFGIDITCVKLTLHEMDDSKIIFQSDILIPLPEAKDYTIQAEKKENFENSSSQKKAVYYQFWINLLNRANSVLPLPYNEPRPSTYYQLPPQRPDIHFEWLIRGTSIKGIGVELHFESSSKDKNLERMSNLEELREVLEQKTGENVTFYKNKYKSTRIFIEKYSDDKLELEIWALEKMKIFLDILGPHLELT
ncbi:MAG: DUF4268 domain-containing protein [Methanomicrobiales archaeon]|nr:DUF4268 domain-containing protein [Methanomicrobiales archaeon]